MSRLRRIEEHDRIFFVTTNLARGVRPLQERERDLILVQLERQRSAAQFALFAYVVMPDHVHLLLSPLGSALSAVMREFKSCTGQHLRRLRGGSGAVWQQRFFDFILRRIGDFGEKVEYIHRNPVEAEFVACAEDWRWSSAAGYAGGTPAVPIDQANIAGDPREWLHKTPRT